VAQIFFIHTKGPWAAQLQEAPLNITMELKHEPTAADVVIFKRGQKGVSLFYKIVYTSMVQH
jgi:hypothetical protein